VFDPFFSTKADGTGLGLPIARQIAVAHGGSLTIESVPGDGTRVEVRLPLAASPG
jgi:two-component system sensor histidine kinase FlrB